MNEEVNILQRVATRPYAKTTEFREKITEFTGCSAETVARWLKGHFRPKGVTLVSMRYFFESLGEDVKGLNVQKVEVYNLGKVIAFGCITYEEVRKRIGYPSIDGVMRLFNGTGTTDERWAEISKIIEEYQTEASHKAHQLKQVLSAFVLSDVSGNEIGKNDTTTQAVQMAATNVEQLYTSLKVLVAPESTRQMRELFRSQLEGKLGGYGVHAVWEQINALLSEDAFKKHSQQTERKKRHVQ